MTPSAGSGVAVTGIGIVSPFGDAIGEVARRFAAGERFLGSSIGDIPIDAVPAERRTRIGRLDRLCRALLSASFLAVRSAGLRLDEEDGDRIGLSFGTGLGCLLTNEEYYRRIAVQGPAAASPQLFAYTVSSAAAGEVSIALGIRGPNVTAHMGFAAGLGAIGYGFDLIELGKADVVIAGGADVTGEALLAALADRGLAKSEDQCVPYRSAVPGMRASEAAVVFVLESGERARRRGVRPWGHVEAYAAGFEPTLTRPPIDSSGIAATLGREIVAAGRRPDEVDLLATGAHGTPIDAAERAALEAVLGARQDALLLAPKHALGDTFAAAGPCALALALALLRERPALADGVALGLDAASLSAPEASRRLARAEVVAVNDVCYSGAVVALLARGG